MFTCRQKMFCMFLVSDSLFVAEKILVNKISACAIVILDEKATYQE